MDFITLQACKWLSGDGLSHLRRIKHSLTYGPYDGPGVLEGQYGAGQRGKSTAAPTAAQDAAWCIEKVSAVVASEETMNYNQYRALLKTTKPVEVRPTLFGMSHRNLLLSAAVAIGVLTLYVL